LAISPIGGVPGLQTAAALPGGQSAGGAGGGFGALLSQALQSAQSYVAQSEQGGIALAAGTAPSIADVMISATQAQLAVDLTVQVRDRVVQAYNQIMNMQI
jgi:flagellar hook-basal body complex protein FliE